MSMRFQIETLRKPDFRLGEHYYRLDPMRELGVFYRFKTISDCELLIDGLVPEGQVISFFDKRGREWMVMTARGAILRKGYAWNGCTPKVYLPVPGVWIGTPDFDATIPGSAWHDAFYQFACCHHFPLHRWECDEVFRRIIEMHGSPRIAKVYHAAVRKWGGWDGDPSREGEWSAVVMAEHYAGDLSLLL
jgi:hypothetical protein